MGLLLRSPPLALQLSALLLRFPLEEKAALEQESFLQSSPGHTRYSNSFRAACCLGEVQPPIFSTHPLRLTAITVSSTAADTPASTRPGPSCPQHPRQYRGRPHCLRSLHIASLRIQGWDPGTRAEVQPVAPSHPEPLQQSYPKWHRLYQSHPTPGHAQAMPRTRSGQEEAKHRSWFP